MMKVRISNYSYIAFMASRMVYLELSWRRFFILCVCLCIRVSVCAANLPRRQMISMLFEKLKFMQSEKHAHYVYFENRSHACSYFQSGRQLNKKLLDFDAILFHVTSS